MNSKFKILIVEDEFIIANQIKNLLLTHGFNVLDPVDCYCTAIEKIERELPDLVITDIRLYDDLIGGIKISKYVSDFFNIPVIFLSGYSDDNTLQLAKLTNPSTFLIKPKPLDKEQLLTTIKIALPIKKEAKDIYKMIAIKGREINENEFENKPNSDLMIHYVSYSEILFIETTNHIVKNTISIHFESKPNAILVRDEIERIMSKLPSNFLRVHKSYIVNILKIKSHKFPNYLFAKNRTIPIGDKFKTELKRHIQL